MIEESVIQCSLCNAMVLESETCSQMACRACHISITFDDCINNTTPDELTLEKFKKEAAR